MRKSIGSRRETWGDRFGVLLYGIIATVMSSRKNGPIETFWECGISKKALLEEFFNCCQIRCQIIGEKCGDESVERHFIQHLL